MVRTFRRVRAAGVLAIAVVSLVGGWSPARWSARGTRPTRSSTAGSPAATASVLGTLVDAEAARVGSSSPQAGVTSTRERADATSRGVHRRDPERRRRAPAARSSTSAVDGIIVIDADGRIEAFNPGAERLFGYPESEVARPQRQHADAVAVPRGARRLPRALSDDRATPRIIGIGREVSGRAATARSVPAASLGRRDDGRRRSGSSPACCTICTERVRLEGRARLERGALASRHRLGRRRHHRDRRARRDRGVQSRGGTAVRLPARRCSGRNVDMLMPSPYHEEHDTLPVALSRHRRAQDHRDRPRGAPGCARTARRFRCICRSARCTIARRAEVHRHPPRSESPRADGRAAARAGGAGQARRNGRGHRARGQESARRHPRRDAGDRQPAAAGEPGRRPIVREIVSRIDALNELMKDLLLFARPPQPRRAESTSRRLVTTTADLSTRIRLQERDGSRSKGRRRRCWPTPSCSRSCSSILLVNGAHAMPERHDRVSATATDGTCRIAFTDQGPGIPPRSAKRSSRRSSRPSREAPASGCRPRSGSSRRIAARSPYPVPTPEGRR